MSKPVSGSFRRPFAEQLAALRLRLGNLVPTSAWDDLVKAQHDRAFMVAGAVKADLLADLAAAVERAVADGTGLEEFRKDFRGIVEKHGWHGWTGEGTAKGEAWRTKVIWRTNMATSYAAGRMAQLVDGKFRFWVYRHGGSLEPRLQHLAWDGVALTPDHPFWAAHYPPNGWGCSCRVTGTNSEAGIKRVGGDPGKVLPEGWQEIDPKTGAPVGISKGWDYAPGGSVAGDILAVVKGKLPQLPAPLGSGLGASLAAPINAAWSDWVAETLTSGGRTAPGLLGTFSPDILREMVKRNIGPKSAEVLVNPGLLVGPKARRHEAKGDALSTADWSNLPDSFRSPMAVLIDKRSGNLLYIVGAEQGTAQLAVDLAYSLNNAPAGQNANVVVSAYRPAIAEVLRRIANGALELLWGEVG